MKNLIFFIKDEFIFVFFLFLTVILSLLFPYEIKNFFYYIDWNTIFILFGLLIITLAIKESGYFDTLAKKILTKLKDEKKIAFFLMWLSVFFSFFCTNDVSLFIVVPLTLTFQTLMKNDLTKLIIFEAIAVNVGSTISPIGNPQNIFLWHKWEISFFIFIWKMLPLEILLLILLSIFIWIVFPSKKIHFISKSYSEKKSFTLFFVSILFLILYIVFLELKLYYYFLFIIIFFYLIFYPKLLLKIDWFLLLLFILLFIDFSVIGNLHFIQKKVNFLNLKSDKLVFLLSTFVSQIISNVPGSVFMSKFSNNWKAITYGVNIGGNGVFLGSLANIIALKMAKNKKIWFDFHKYSIPFFLISSILTYLLFF